MKIDVTRPMAMPSDMSSPMSHMPRNCEISSELNPKSEVSDDMMIALPVLPAKMLSFPSSR